MAAKSDYVFLCIIVITAMLITTCAKPKSEEAGYEYSVPKPKDKICLERSWFEKCVIEKVRKPFNLFNTIGFLIGGNKNNDQGRGYVHSPSATSSKTTKTVNNPVNVIHTTPKTVSPTSFRPSTLFEVNEEPKIVQKNLHRLQIEKCGVALEGKILGGDKTMPGEFPWLARLLFKSKYFPQKGLLALCGGSLITDNYVLTAAHCITRYPYKLKYVRFGEYNTELGKMNCSENEVAVSTLIDTMSCKAEPPRDYEVESFVAHENYTRGNGLPHDIALIRLKKRVQYTRFIRPVCLPVGELSTRWNHMNFGVELIVAGWGMTEKSEGNSPIPLKATIPLMEIEACRHFLGRELTPGQLCVGKDDGGSTCNGDSGGPLVLTNKMMHLEDNFIDYSTDERTEEITIQVGIVSFGMSYCTKQPTVFTSIEFHMPWILLKMKP